MQFWKKHGVSIPAARPVLQHFGAQITSISDKVLSSRLSKIMTRFTSLNKSIRQTNGQEKLDHFVQQPADLSDVATTLNPSATMATVVFPSPTPEPSQTAGLRRKIEERIKELEILKQERDVLHEHSKEKSNDIRRLQEELKKIQIEKESLQADHLATKEQLLHARNTIKAIRSTNYYKRLQRRDREISKKAAIIAAHESGHCMSIIKALRRKVKLEQTKLSHARAQIEKLHCVKCEVEALKKQATHLESQLGDKTTVRLKNESGHFTPEAVLCLIQLVGECEIAPARCGTVIQTISRHLLNIYIPDTDLPSERSVLRFADHGHVLSKLQLAEKVINCNTFDLHMDGTSKCGKKYVTQQVNVDGQVLSFGFVPVALENTSTLVDISRNLLQELSEVFDKAEAHQHFLQMLSQLSGIMSDRASVMKSTARQLDQERQQMLQTEETQLEFLHCNAHFLLGVSSECERIFQKMEKEKGEKLGRDKLPLFRSFQSSTESSAERYIRTACDCLGPRGDEKNGCRDTWLTYCSMINITSKITSFRGNRFKIFFEAAGALHFHKGDIAQFLGQYHVKHNKKIASVLEDNKCNVISSHMVALGLFFYRLTGPYWQLLGMEGHYLDFYIHVNSMLQFVRRWTADPEDAFSRDFQPLFGSVFMPNPEIFSALLDIPLEMQLQVKIILQPMCAGVEKKIQDQLSDFLEGGKYHEINDAERREKMKHCKLTNLVGEQAFGDLDFSIFKRRHASVHHHSSIQMMKRNNTVSAWLCSKDESEQLRLLSLATTKASDLRSKHRQEEKECIQRRRTVLEENKRKKMEADHKRNERVNSIVSLLAPHQGPCRSPADVNRLLLNYKARIAQYAAIKAELQYKTVVLNEKSPHLNVTGKTFQQLVASLKSYLAESAGKQNSFDVLPSDDDHSEPPQKQQCMLPANAPNDSDEDFEPTSEQSNFEVHVFGQVGQVVAVHYDDDLYIGEVTSVVSEEEGCVNFLERCRVKENVFRWPKVPDRCIVHRDYVFFSSVTLVPVSASIRAFRVEEIKTVLEKHNQFKELFC